MIEIILIQLATAVACYFIGVFTGRQSAKHVIREWQAEHDDRVEISHVGYDTEQMGREK